MAIEQKILFKIIQEKFPDATIKVVDTVGDMDHYLIEIIDKQFVNLSKVQQHKIVHKALESVLNKNLHAIELKTSS
jgi:stress-induced morphogen